MLLFLSLLATSRAQLHGSPLPKVDPEHWAVWSPTPYFQQQFEAWSDEQPEEMLVWCKAFIPTQNTSGAKMLNDHAVMEISLPFGIPLPGYVGQCAAIDGRTWAPESVYDSGRPSDARFGAYVKISGGGTVESRATCGFSHNYCCSDKCGDARYGDQTCGPLHCPDEEMQMRRVRCWTKDTAWSAEGIDCSEANGTILAVKAYVQGRGGDPCVKPLGISSPPASWDIGIVMFPTKRRAMITGFVDDGPATECYAQATEAGSVARAVLAQLPMPSGDMASKLVGFSDRPLNKDGDITYLPRQLSMIV